MEESRSQHASSRIARGWAQRRSRRNGNFSRSRAGIMARIFNARTVENVAPYVQQSASSWLALFFHRSQHQYYYWRRGTRRSAGFREHCRNWVEIFASINESFSLADTSLQCFFALRGAARTRALWKNRFPGFSCFFFCSTKSGKRATKTLRPNLSYGILREFILECIATLQLFSSWVNFGYSRVWISLWPLNSFLPFGIVCALSSSVSLEIRD